MSEHQESYQEGRQDMITHIEMAVEQLKQYGERNPRYKPGIEYSVDLLEGIIEHSKMG